MVVKRWSYGGRDFQLPMVGENSYSVLDILPDETGFFAMERYDMPEAYVLNGDGSIRVVLKPAFNVRGFDAPSPLSKQVLKGEEEPQSIFDPVPPNKQLMFHYKTDRVDMLEIFGDDGFGDCYYRYDAVSGKLLSTEAHPRRS